MSKSDPNSAIFMEDSEADVSAKIKKAFCPPAVVEGNPCIEYIKYIVMPWFGSFSVSNRGEGAGGWLEGLAPYLAVGIARLREPCSC